MILSEKVALVTGGTRGVGRETVIELCNMGCSVAFSYRSDHSAADELSKQLHDAGCDFLCLQGDVSARSDVESWVNACVTKFQRLDYLINNAATTFFIPYEDLDALTEEVWRRIFDVNVLGPFYCSRAALPFLQARPNGHIINIASTAGMSTVGSCMAYAASKAALIKLTKDLARIAGPRVQVNCVAPGFIEGEWLKQGLGDRYEGTKTFVEENSALKSVCKPNDIASAIVGTLTGSRMITGQVVVVDGGFSNT